VVTKIYVCKYCKKEIQWEQDGERWVPMDIHVYGEKPKRHRCEEYTPPSKAKKEVKQQSNDMGRFNWPDSEEI
jgi:hypothetical protein